MLQYSKHDNLNVVHNTLSRLSSPYPQEAESEIISFTFCVCVGGKPPNDDRELSHLPGMAQYAYLRPTPEPRSPDMLGGLCWVVFFWLHYF